MSAVVLLGSAAAYIGYKHFYGQISRIAGVTRGNTGPDQNYLLVGSDSRAGANQVQGVGTTRDAGGMRTDTMMLVHISPKRAQATIVSLPRDSLVTIPGHGPQKLNSAVPLGEATRKGSGPALLVQTIEQVTGLAINHYVQIDFAGFLAMTNAVGGVDVCLSQPAVDLQYTGINLPAGKHHLSGILALQYVRQRHGLPQGDIDRIKRQQTFMGAIVRKVTSAGTLLDPTKLLPFLNAATKAVQVDDKLSFNDMKTLASKLRHLDPAHVQFETIPITGTGSAGAVGSVVFLDQARMPAFFQSIKDNTIGQPTPTGKPTNPTTKLTVAPSSISVNVLNGTGVTGRARTAADDLTRVGFGISGTGNALGGPYPHSVVRYGPTRADSARTLAAAVTGAVLEPDSQLGNTVTLVVGTDYAGAHPVTLTATKPPTIGGSTPDASPKPPPVTAAEDICGI